MKNQIQFTGTLINILPEKHFTTKAGNDFVVRELVIKENEEKYPSCVVVQLSQDIDTETLQSMYNKSVTANIDFSAREYNERWFNTVRCWKLSLSSENQEAISNNNNVTYFKEDVKSTQKSIQEIEDKLPF